MYLLCTSIQKIFIALIDGSLFRSTHSCWAGSQILLPRLNIGEDVRYCYIICGTVLS
jgi:hypothetical protein